MSGKQEALLDKIESYDAEFLGIDIDKLNIKEQQKHFFDRYKSNTEHRSWLAQWTAYVVTSWLVAVIVIVLFSQQLKLSDVIVSVLLGTTTLNVLGLSFIVLRGYFGTDEKPFS